MPTQAKIDKVAALKEQLAEANNIIITDYMGLDVAQMTKMRRDLREQGVTFFISKNTLMRLAAKEAGFDEMIGLLNGPTAIAVSNTDPNIPTKILFDAKREFDNVKKPEIRALFIDKQLYDGQAAERIAKLPSREILLSQLISAIEGPISEFVGTIDGIMRELVGTIDALARKKGED
ncbi:MAG: 50S ribosomal protein L10 [candidate division Zixibacteria bacterium]